jgi:hypothetical protein
MNRMFRAALVAALLPAGFASVGCTHSSGPACGAGGGCGAGGTADGGRFGRGHCWDPSWPERYNYAARQSVVAPFAQQAANGHFLHQTLWNFYFEPGSDKLTPGGMEKLSSLARATPGPDPRIYIQTAQDIGVTPDNVTKVAAVRSDLDAKRAAAIRQYMATTFGPGAEYEVYVHDAPVPSVYGVFAGNAFRGQATGYVGGLNAPGVASPSVGRGSLSGPPPGTGGNTTVNVVPPSGPAPAP